MSLRQALPNASPEWLAALEAWDGEWEINTKSRFAHFVGQLAHESVGFTRFEERLSYGAPRLVVIWPTRFPDLAAAAPYARNPVLLANSVYADRLGNGNQGSGDGYRFRGRGPIQLTGRANYRAAGQAIDVDLIAEPDRLLEPAVGLLAAGWFWKSKGLNELADIDDITSITKRINGGLIGLADRLEWVLKIEEAIA